MSVDSAKLSGDEGGRVVPLDANQDIVLYVGESPPTGEHVRGVIVAQSPDADVVAARLRDVAAVGARIERIRDRLQLDLEQILDAIEEVSGSRPHSTHPESQLTEHDQATLREAGMLRPAPSDRAKRASTRGALRYAELLARSMTVKEVAARLKVTEGRIRQRLGEKTLYGFQTKRGWRLPDFQIRSGETLPGLERVLAALPAGLHPLTVEGFFVQAQPDLMIGEETVSAAEWLSAGHDPAPVVELASNLTRV